MDLQKRLIETLNFEIEELNSFQKDYDSFQKARKIDNGASIVNICAWYQAKIEEKSKTINRIALLVGLLVVQNKAKEWELQSTQELEKKQNV